MEHEGIKMSFVQLLQADTVEIPIIQRDYAQGRKDKEELRINFLTSLRNALINQEEINLDFIYGSKINDTMQPLDGQQRLTTLFLIHWYACAKEGLLEENRKLLTKFTYETRTSSREFCVSLIGKSIEIINNEVIISEEIRNSIWYFLNWNKDPTIDAMLRTIDDIHRLFYDVDDLWNLLKRDDFIISFNYIELRNFGLSDDLYIKMNARGKELTPFENFKAMFEKQIDHCEWDKDIEFYDSFSYKMDTKWTDLFWSHRSNNLIDTPVLSLFATVAMVYSAIEKPTDRHNTIRLLQNTKTELKAKMFTLDAYRYLHKCTDKYCDLYTNNSLSKLKFPFDQYIYNGDVFKTMFYKNSNPGYTQKVIFYAQTEYLLRVQDYNESHFNDWMRVVRNIVYRGDFNRTSAKAALVRSPESFDGVINLIKELSVGCENIYNFLPNCKIKSQISRLQIEEEITKAKLINISGEYKDAIHEAEDLNFTSGQIQILFDAIGYSNGSQFDINGFRELVRVIKMYIEGGITDKLRRALLSIEVDGKYEFYNYWWSWSQVVDGNKRCLIAKHSELEYFVFGNYKENKHYKRYFIELLRKLVDRSLDEILDEFEPPTTMPNWKNRLIKDPDLITNHCKSKYIAIPNDEQCCYLLKGVRPRDLTGTYKVI